MAGRCTKIPSKPPSLISSRRWERPLAKNVAYDRLKAMARGCGSCKAQSFAETNLVVTSGSMDNRCVALCAWTSQRYVIEILSTGWRCKLQLAETENPGAGYILNLNPDLENPVIYRGEIFCRYPECTSPKPTKVRKHYRTKHGLEYRGHKHGKHLVEHLQALEEHCGCHRHSHPKQHTGQYRSSWRFHNPSKI